MSNCDFSIEIGEGFFRCSICNRLGGKGDVQECLGNGSKPIKNQKENQIKLRGIDVRTWKPKDCGCGKR